MWFLNSFCFKGDILEIMHIQEPTFQTQREKEEPFSETPASSGSENNDAVCDPESD